MSEWIDGGFYALAFPGYYWLGADGHWYGVYEWVAAVVADEPLSGVEG